MIDFLDDAEKYMCKNRTAPSDLPASLFITRVICSCVKLYQIYLFLCQIIPKISVHVSNYTEAICLCVKFEIIIYYQSYH